MATTAAHFQLTVTDADFTPVSQHKEKRKWKAIQEISSLQFQGGYTTKAEAAKTKLATGPDGDPVTLVHVAKREDWLARMAGGPLKRAGKVLDTLREKYFAITDANPSALADVDSSDPMQQLDEPADDENLQTPKRPRESKASKRRANARCLRGRVLSLEMPARSKSAAPDDTSTVEATFAIFSPTGPGDVWISSKNIPWLLGYLADEVNTGGVALSTAPAGESQSAPADESQSAPADESQSTFVDESSESQSPSRGSWAKCNVPGLCIRLKPDAGNVDEYEAIFVDGPLKGQQLRSKVSTMNQDKWDKLQACAEDWQCPGPDISAAHVQRHHKVSAVVQLLQMTMAEKLAAAERMTDDTIG